MQSGTIAVDARLGTAATPKDAYDICLMLLAPSGETEQIDCLPPDPLVSTTNWPADDVRRGNYVFPIAESVNPGSYELALSLAKTGTTEPIGEVAPIGSVSIHPFSPSSPLEASWQNEISLLGYDLFREEANLELVLFWQAHEPIKSSYKVFVHLVDLETEEIIAQTDAIPRDWTYATNNWVPGEIVRDVIDLPLSGNLPAAYELRVGLYDESTSQRALVNSSESSTPQEYLTLRVTEP